MEIQLSIRDARMHTSVTSKEEHYTLVITDNTVIERISAKYVPDGEYRVNSVGQDVYHLFDTANKRDLYIGQAPEYITEAIIAFKLHHNVDVEDLHLKRRW
jgi:hypothetical protein